MRLSSLFPRLIRRSVLYVLVGLFLLTLWKLIVAIRVFDETLFPSPTATLKAMRLAWPELAKDIPYSFELISGGFVLTVFLSFVIAVLLHLVPKVSSLLFDVLVMLQSIPLFAIAPVLFYFTGRGHTTLDQLITIILAAFFPVLVTTVDGLTRVDRDLIDVFNAMNATRWQKLVKLEIPSALYSVIAGSKITLTMCVIGTVLAEMLVGEQRGLGFRIKEANAMMNMGGVFASLILLAILTIVLFGALTFIAELAQPWASSEEE